jgi:serine protease inhibitor
LRHLVVTCALLFLTSSLYAQSPEIPDFQSTWCKDRKDKMNDFIDAKLKVAMPMNSFALALWKESKKDQPNPAMSPWSIYTVLAMALGGAKERTENEMAAALGLKEPPSEAWYQLHKSIMSGLICPQPYSTTLLSYGNGIFAQTGKALQPKFVNLMKTAFDTEPLQVDFKKEPEKARKEINNWIEERTQKRVTDLLGANSITSNVRLVLANAVFIKGTWAMQFGESATRDQDFHLSEGKTVKAPMMFASGGARDFKYYKAKGWSAVSMGTSDHAIEFVVLRPDTVNGLSSIEKSLSAETLSTLFKGLQAKKVHLYLPKFSSDQSWNLVESLSKIGIKDAFSANQANFRGIDNGNDQLFIGDIAHKAIVKVDEKGFEGAAATAAAMPAGGMPPKEEEPIEFVVDRPFLYLIKDTPTDAIIFIGTVSNPTK